MSNRSLAQEESPPLADRPAPPAEVGPAVAPRPGERRPSAGFQARAGFFADLAQHLEDGEPILRAAEAAASTWVPDLAPDLANQIFSGRSLSEVLGSYPESFSPYELGMIAAGEEGGTLDRQLRVLANSMKGTEVLRSRLWSTVFPIFLLLGLGLPAALLWPVLEGQGQLPFAVGVLGTLAGTALLWVLLAGLHGWLGRSERYRKWEEDLLERLPGIGPVLRLRAGGRFLRSLGPLLAAGLPVQRAALLASGCTGSTKYALSLLEAAHQIEQGYPVLDSLAPTGLLSTEVLAEVGRGENQGDLPERLAEAEARLHEVASRATLAAFPGVVIALTVLTAAFTLASVFLARALLQP